MAVYRPKSPEWYLLISSVCSFTGGYNINDVMFYWTRGNESVSGLDTLQLAQYTVEDHYTSVSEAVYETGKIEVKFWVAAAEVCSFQVLVSLFVSLFSWRPLPPAGFPLWAEKEHFVFHPRDLCPLQPAGGPLMGLLLDFLILCSSSNLYR